MMLSKNIALKAMKMGYAVRGLMGKNCRIEYISEEFRRDIVDGFDEEDFRD